jgi:hypothetical protein
MRRQGTSAELEALRRRAVKLLDEGWVVKDVAQAGGAAAGGQVPGVVRLRVVDRHHAAGSQVGVLGQVGPCAIDLQGRDPRKLVGGRTLLSNDWQVDFLSLG